MCSVVTHPAVPLALSALLPQDTVSTPLLLTGIACSVIPDLDVIGFAFGIRYHTMLGHRGLSHSLCFAVVLSAAFTFSLFRPRPERSGVVFLFLFVSTLSHALLDMLTNGGLGVALFAPVSNTRYFFPWRPIEVSPIAISRFFSPWGLRILLSELRWVWLPSGVVFVLGQALRRYG
jgi:inner membrane protein